MAAPDTLAARPALDRLLRAKTGHPGGKRTQTGLYVRAVRGIRIRDARIARMVKRLQDEIPHLRRTEFSPICRRWSEAEILRTVVFHNLVEKDGKAGVNIVNELGDPRRMLGEWGRLASIQTKLEMEMGMTPASAAAIRLSLTGGNGAGLAAMAAARRKPQSADGQDD